MSITLTPDEIYEITGKVQPAAQLRHLRKMGIRAHPSDNPERPVVVVREWLTDRKTSSVESRPQLRSEKKAA